MAEQHTHEIDGKLHEGCAMCDLIKERTGQAKREAQAMSSLTQHQKVAQRSRIGRDELKRQGIDEKADLDDD
jgi:hypothetical protein